MHIILSLIPPFSRAVIGQCVRKRGTEGEDRALYYGALRKTEAGWDTVLRAYSGNGPLSICAPVSQVSLWIAAKNWKDAIIHQTVTRVNKSIKGEYRKLNFHLISCANTKSAHAVTTASNRRFEQYEFY